MKAVVGTSYGAPDKLQLQDIPSPTIGEKDVLVRVHAASVNALDWHMATGTPMFMRLMSGLSKPKRAVRGVDVAGVVEEVGAGVTRFKPGDEVFGLGSGSFAEYVSAEEKELQPKPSGLRFEEAAALPIAGVTALQALRKASVSEGQRVLVVGAGGGVGAFAVQLAKVSGARVTGVCSSGKVDFVRSLGADDVVDYTRADFSRTGAEYEVIVDAVADRPLADMRRVLSPAGTLVSLGGGKNDSRIVGPLLEIVKVMVVSRLVKQRIVVMLAKVTPESLEELASFYGPGKLAVPVDRTVSLPETPEAINRLYTGGGRGKTVVLVHA